ALEGGKIYVNALPGQIVEQTYDLRQLLLRIDDNDAPGRMTMLNLATQQSAAELRQIAKLGGLCCIDVINILSSGLVFGRIMVLLAPKTPGGPVAVNDLSEKDREGFKFHPETHALLSLVSDASGRPAYFHFCCLRDDGTNGKTSATEKAQRLAQMRA